MLWIRAAWHVLEPLEWIWAARTCHVVIFVILKLRLYVGLCRNVLECWNVWFMYEIWMLVIGDWIKCMVIVMYVIEFDMVKIGIWIMFGNWINDYGLNIWIMSQGLKWWMHLLKMRKSSCRFMWSICGWFGQGKSSSWNFKVSMYKWQSKGSRVNFED